MALGVLFPPSISRRGLLRGHFGVAFACKEPRSGRAEAASLRQHRDGIWDRDWDKAVPPGRSIPAAPGTPPGTCPAAAPPVRPPPPPRTARRPRPAGITRDGSGGGRDPPTPEPTPCAPLRPPAPPGPRRPPAPPGSAAAAPAPGATLRAPTSPHHTGAAMPLAAAIGCPPRSSHTALSYWAAPPQTVPLLIGYSARGALIGENAGSSFPAFLLASTSYGSSAWSPAPSRR